MKTPAALVSDGRDVHGCVSLSLRVRFFAQALIPAEAGSQRSFDRRRGDRREPAAKIGVGKRSRGHADAIETPEHRVKLRFRLDSAEDEVGMLVAGRQKSARHFHARVAGLNGPLRVRQIPPHESVDVLNFALSGCLRETCLRHHLLLLKKRGG
jgi:hypothetical protein